jgi:regulatory protein
VPGRRRGARTGRGWDAAPPRSRPTKPRERSAEDHDDPPLWTPEEDAYTRAPGRSSEPTTNPRGTGPASDLLASELRSTDKDPAQVARDICLQQLAVRPRTRAELATILRKRGIADSVAAEVLDRYDEVGLIDDAAFARAWVTSRHHGKGLARRALAGELRRRGVDGEVVGAALEEVDGDTEAATARALVDRKLRSMASAPPDAVFRRLVGMLARKGYPPGVAVGAVKDALAARDDEAGAFAGLIDPDAMPDLLGESDDPIR